MSILPGSDKSIVEKAKKNTKKIEPELKELILGRRTILSILSFGVGTVLVGNFIWIHSSRLLGDWVTLGFGLLLFIIGGIAGKKFRK